MDETKRLLAGMEKHLGNRDYLAGSYSIADIAIYPWLKATNLIGIVLAEDYPKIAQWADQIAARPAVQRAYAVGEATRENQKMDGSMPKVSVFANS
ncbi:MAG: glutathione binding-like protein [Pseudanabaena sp.]|jgi:GST-like protein